MSLPTEYESWRCNECPKGKQCEPVYYPCDECNDEDTNCAECHGQGGGHVCVHSEP